MVSFSSARERRFWFWLAVVLVGIYATLGRAPAIAAALRERNDLRDTIFFALFLLLAVVSILFIRRRPGRAEIGLGIGLLVIYLAAWLRIGTMEERTHLFEYGLVAALIHEALIERHENGRLARSPVFAALLLSLIAGLTDELIQSALPNRVFDIRDIAFNSVAAALVIGGRWGLEVVRRQF
jgi:VanZ family protein